MSFVTKGCLTLILVSSLALSCEHESVNTRPNQISKLATKITSSSGFRNMNISLSDLNVGNAHFINKEENSVVIPYLGMDGKRGILALFDKDFEVRTVIYFEVMSSLDPNQVQSKMESGEFNGSFIIGNEYGRLQLNLERSKLVSRSTIRNEDARTSKVAECNDITQPGGAYDCAGARIQNLNWVDKIACYAFFVECFALNVASCIVDDCEVSPRVSD
jgi:hypothetical protein